MYVLSRNIKKYQSFCLSENFQFLEVKFSIHMDRHVLVMFRKFRVYTVKLYFRSQIFRLPSRTMNKNLGRGYKVHLGSCMERPRIISVISESSVRTSSL